MNWEAIGAVGEIIGALAVVVTLLILIRQIRENTISTNAATASSYMQAYSQANLSMGEPVRASIIRRGMEDPDSLSADESQAFFQSIAGMLPLWESLFLMHQNKTIPEPHWLVGRNDISTFTSTPGGRKFIEGFLDFYDESFPEFSMELRNCMREKPLFDVVQTGGLSDEANET